MLGRIIGSLIAIGLYETAMILATPRLLIASGQAAGGQFDNGDSAFVVASVRISLYGKPGAIPAIVLLVVLLLVWWGPIKRRLSTPTMAAAVCLLFGAAPAQAYYDKPDYTEAYMILPNESEAYLNASNTSRPTGDWYYTNRP